MAKRLPISKQFLRDLSLERLAELSDFIRALILEKKDQEKRLAAQRKREVLEEKTVDSKTYRLVLIRCGKEACHCNEGNGHGPYWYAYWSEKGRTRSKYVGKKLPT